MNMKKCKACGKDIAQNADRCPNCGCIIPMSDISAAVFIIALLLMIVVIGGAVVSCGNAIFFR